MSQSAGSASGLSQKIHELLDRGSLPDFQALLSQSHPGLRDGSVLAENLEKYRELVRVLSAIHALPPLPSGVEVGDFRVESFLASGGSGQVYRARQLSLGGRLVALKVTPTAGLTERERRRLFREAEAAGGVHHPSLVEVYGCGEETDRGLFYCAMRLVEGSTLEERLQELSSHSQPPSEPERREVVERMREVAEALGDLHARGLIHRDVKPGNIILQEDNDDTGSAPRAVLVDFGLLRRPRSGTTTAPTSLRATPEYAAPEQLLGRTTDPRSDVFSLGACLHDLLAGRAPTSRPCAADSPLEPLGKVVPGLDRDLEAIVLRATDPSPSRRYRDGKALAADLGAWLQGSPVEARPLRGLEAARRWIRLHPDRARRRGLQALVATLLLAGLVLGVERAVWVVRLGSKAESSFQAGDWGAALNAAGAIPGPIRGAFLSEEFESILLARSPVPVDPASEVARALATRGLDPALLRAAAYLQKDGLPAHPRLASFLHHHFQVALLEIPAPVAGSLPTLTPAMRLFYERPVFSPEELRASRRFRGCVTTFLTDASPADPTLAERYLAALAVLTGCGDVESVELVRESLRRCAAVPCPETREAARLAIRCLEVIFLRAHGCGYLVDVTRANPSRLVDEVSEAVQELDPGLPRSGALKGATQSLLVAILLAQRAAGVRQELAVPRRGEPWSRILAASQDPLYKARLRRGDWVQERAEEFRYLGIDAALYDDPELADTMEQLLQRAAIARGLSLDRVSSSWEEGLEEGRKLLRGVLTEAEPDLDTRLQAILEPGAQGSRPALVQEMPKQLHVAAAWDFQHDHIQATQGPGSVRLLGARFFPASDPTRQDWNGYVRLGPAGSEVHLALEWPEGPGRQSPLYLALELQPALRAYLPRRGEIALEVVFAGNQLPVAHLLLDDTSKLHCLIPLPTPPPLLAKPLKLVLRAGAATTTTTRIYRVAILTQPFLPFVNQSYSP